MYFVGMESPMDLVLKHAPNWKAVAKDLGFSDKRVEHIESDYTYSQRDACISPSIQITKPTENHLANLMLAKLPIKKFLMVTIHSYCTRLCKEGTQTVIYIPREITVLLILLQSAVYVQLHGNNLEFISTKHSTFHTTYKDS